MEERREGEDWKGKYEDLQGRFNRLLWWGVASLVGLGCTLVYSRYQIYRKERVIDEKSNEIEDKKEEIFLLKNKSKLLNVEMLDEVKIILKNLKNTVLNDAA